MEDRASIPENLRNLFFLRSSDDEALAWAHVGRIDPDAFRKAGGSKGWIDKVVKGSVRSGLVVKEDDARDLKSGIIRRVLYDLPPAAGQPGLVVTSFYAVAGERFVAIGVKAPSPVRFDDEAYAELERIAKLQRQEI